MWILHRTFVNNMHVWCRFVAVCCQVTHPHCAMVPWFCRWRIIFGSAQIAGQFARQLGDMTNVGARTPAGCCTGPELRTPGAAPQTRMVSVARIRLGSWESARAFKGIICDDVSEFESYMPSHAVGSLWRVYPVHGLCEQRRPWPPRIRPCNGEEIRCASARFYVLQTVIN